MLEYSQLDIASSPNTKLNQAAKTGLKTRYSGDGFPSGLLLFDMSPGPAIMRSPLCIKQDISHRGFATSRKEGDCLDARSGEGESKRQPGALGRGWPRCNGGWKEDALCSVPAL